MKRRWSPTLSVTGALSSFGCAACCALPIMLAGTGLAGAWTLHLQLLVGPYERWWLWGSIILLAVGAVAWGRELHARAIQGRWRISLITDILPPIMLAASIALLIGTLRIEHASLIDFL